MPPRNSLQLAHKEEYSSVFLIAIYVVLSIIKALNLGGSPLDDVYLGKAELASSYFKITLKH